MTRVTIDSISLRDAGVVTVAQPTKGHRFTLDSILLADYCRLRPRARVLELGAGTGVISLLLARKHPGITITAVEIQEEAADLCRWNAQVNGLSDRVTVIEADIAHARKTLPSGSFDAIIANPPYTDPHAGKRSPLASRCIAREGGIKALARWIESSALLKNKGRFFLIYSAPRQAELSALLCRNLLEPKRIRFIHPAVDRSATLVLVEAVRSAAPGAEVLPPLILRDDNGSLSQAMQDIYAIPR